MRTQTIVLALVLVAFAGACATTHRPVPRSVSKQYTEESQSPITRAEAADLLVRGLDLQVRLAATGTPDSAPPLALPTETGLVDPTPFPQDAVHDARLGSIAFATGIRLRGLEIRPDGRFEPDRAILRAEWALALEDVLMRAGGGAAAEAAAVEAQPAPPDVPAEHFARGAARTAIALDLLALKENGRFDLVGLVTRGEALVSVSRLGKLLEVR